MSQSRDGGLGVEAVERALSLLQCFEAPGETLTLARLAQRSALSKSTILRLVSSLIRKGFLHRDAAGHYLLGPELQRLGRMSGTDIDLGDLIRPVLRELSAAAQETASFYIRDGEMRVCRFRQNSSRAARHHLDEGSRHPLGSGAAGQILQAFGEGADPAGAAVRRNGFAVSIGGRDPELSAIGVPLHNAAGELLGALIVSGLTQRFTPEAIETYRTALLREAAALRPRLPRQRLS